MLLGAPLRIVLPQDQGVVEVLQHFPGGLLNLVTGENHIHAGLHSILNLDGQNAGVAVEVLGLALEAVESVGVLQV